MTQSNAEKTQTYTETEARFTKGTEIFGAMEDDCWERRYYFDAMTQAIVCVTEQVRGELQMIYDEQGEEVDSLPTRELQRAHTVEMNDDRFWRVPGVNIREKLKQCDLFAKTIQSPIQNLLYHALDYQDYAWFERVLKMEPAEYDRWEVTWLAYLQEKFDKWITQQLASDS